MAKSGKGSVFVRFFKTLVDGRWFFAVSASSVATILGITLTFGINSCREQERTKREMQRSMLQAIGNIKERTDDAERWIDRIEAQNNVFLKAYTYYAGGEEIPDSVCREFRETLPLVRLASFDHDFEKIFRGSYQLWQQRMGEDSLTYYISDCFDGLNLIEKTSEQLIESNLQEMGEVNSRHNLATLSDKEWTLAFVSSPDYYFYMSIRIGKTAILSQSLDYVRTTYDTKIEPRVAELER